VNCGAIPEGTIDSELFGHEKGSFTGAHEARKGYFEVANGGTIFLDEVGELPHSTQVRLLRVLESGEFIKVGSSKVQKTNVRIVAATNVELLNAISTGKFREDLYYRLNTVPIRVPPLRDRKEDIFLLFRKFASDFAERYRMPAISLSPEAQQLLIDYRWPGNVRQLKNITEQMSILEKNRLISGETLHRYLPPAPASNLPAIIADGAKGGEFSERELLYKVLFEMKRDVNDLKRIMGEMIQSGGVSEEWRDRYAQILTPEDKAPIILNQPTNAHPITPHEEVDETLSLAEKERELIEKALRKHKGRRRQAAQELGISERTLYRKIEELGINL
jgi:DNA-binding NtrC family response regulator